MIRVSVDILNADAATPVATVDAIADATVQDMISGDSTGELSVGLESAVKDHLNAWGRVLRWNLDGEPVEEVRGTRWSEVIIPAMIGSRVRKNGADASPTAV